MKRREFITLIGGVAVARPLAAGAQPAKIARIGFMRAAGPNEKEFDAFRSGLRALGYVESQNIVIELSSRTRLISGWLAMACIA
jgi:putative tryptophan/tyrosine transport system substrate-binding protein